MFDDVVDLDVIQQVSEDMWSKVVRLVNEFMKEADDLAEILTPLFSVGLSVAALLLERRLISSMHSSSKFKPEKTGNTKLADVKGCDEAKAEILELLHFLKYPDKFRKFGAKLPNGVLFTGPPGTGKTMIARAVATEANVPFYYASSSSFEEVYAGVGASRLRDLFASAKKTAPCVMFVDEIDALCPSRDLGSTTSLHTTNQLLELLDGFEKTQIVFIAATNAPQHLDKALLRPGRLDKIVHFQHPSLQGRREILQVYFNKLKGKGTSVNIDTIAQRTIGYTGADLANVVNTAAIRCGSLGQTSVTDAHVEWAEDRIQLGMQTGKVLSNKEKAITAVHEAGHALVNILMAETSDPLYKATILPRGKALGVTMRLPQADRVLQTKEQLNTNILIAMGGRVAEELGFGKQETTTGAHSDMEGATSLSYDMVTKYGMSTKFGCMTLLHQHSLSNATKDEIDNEVKGLLDAAYKKVRELLSNNTPQLYAIAEGLLLHEVLTGKQMHQLANDVVGAPRKDIDDFVQLIRCPPTPLLPPKVTTKAPPQLSTKAPDNPKRWTWWASKHAVEFGVVCAFAGWVLSVQRRS